MDNLFKKNFSIQTDLSESQIKGKVSNVINILEIEAAKESSLCHEKEADEYCGPDIPVRYSGFIKDDKFVLRRAGDFLNGSAHLGISLIEGRIKGSLVEINIKPTPSFVIPILIIPAIIFLCLLPYVINNIQNNGLLIALLFIVLSSLLDFYYINSYRIASSRDEQFIKDLFKADKF